jgi:hypothetical protein
METVGRGVVVDFFASCFINTEFVSRPGYHYLDLGVCGLIHSLQLKGQTFKVDKDHFLPCPCRLTINSSA